MSPYTIKWKPEVIKNPRSRPASRTVQKAVWGQREIPDSWLRFGECELDPGVGLWGIEPFAGQPPTSTHLMKLRGFTAEVKLMPLEQSDTDTLASITVSYWLKERRAVGERWGHHEWLQAGKAPCTCRKSSMSWKWCPSLMSPVWEQHGEGFFPAVNTSHWSRPIDSIRSSIHQGH